MTPETHSFLRSQIDRIAAAGGDIGEAMQCARQYLELERTTRAPRSARIEGINSRRQRRNLKLVKS